MKDVVSFLKRRIDFAEKRAKMIKAAHIDSEYDPEQKHNYCGGYSLGHWEGRLRAYENALAVVEGLEVEEDEDEGRDRQAEPTHS